MKTTVVANPGAAGGRVGRNLSKYERAVRARFGPSDVRLSQAVGGVEQLVREAANERTELIAVIGGDGSIGEAFNGLAALGLPPDDAPGLVFLPAGTGGDFARSIGMAGWSPDDGLAACSPRRIDRGCVVLRDPLGQELTRRVANIVSTGASAAIAEAVNRTSKRLGRLGFALGTLKGLAAWSNRVVRIRVDDRIDREIEINSVAVANGRCFGGGMRVAPSALLDDGLLDVITIGPVGPIRFISQGRRLYRGTHLTLPEIEQERGQEVIIEPVDLTAGPIPVEIDGEQPGFLPMRVNVEHASVTLHAPWERAEAIRQ